MDEMLSKTRNILFIRKDELHSKFNRNISLISLYSISRNSYMMFQIANEQRIHYVLVMFLIVNLLIYDRAGMIYVISPYLFLISV